MALDWTCMETSRPLVLFSQTLLIEITRCSVIIMFVEYGKKLKQVLDFPLG